MRVTLRLVSGIDGVVAYPQQVLVLQYRELNYRKEESRCEEMRSQYK